ATLVTVQRSQIVQRYRDIRMIETKGFFHYCQRSLIQWFGVSIATLRTVQLGKIVQAACTLPYRKREPVQLLCLGIAILVTVQRSQTVQRYRDIRMIGTEDLFSYRQRSLEQ